ncbi:RNA polymerase sigma-70 factor [Chitinophaga pendula]|uniref:RNA polymerase sigma factor n=1 Tax=Chitinophaga TaxID=79328 RepID=UPI000BAEED19|nr:MULTISPECIES: RNA polymerase sigma-70 factor [Chitinophaga]ASZ12283.1 hypothetical protein CK934_15600 [Chitinophaga sp. MD30]UCJ10128.1 RNA polymerase sigma-70 factor [Chitinophaga pendula]
MQVLLTKISRNNDQLAFRQLFMTYCDRLIGFAAALVPSREEAEEVVSDVFVKLWQQREQLAGIQHLNAYLYRAVRNTAYNYRQRSGENLQILEGEYIQVLLHTAAITPEEALISKENLQRITQAINALPPRCKLIFRLVKEDGLKYREVADILDISINTVNTQMAAALKKLSAVIASQPHSDWFR